MSKTKSYPNWKLTFNALGFPIAFSLVMTILVVNNGCTKMDKSSASSVNPSLVELKITDSTYLSQINLVSDSTGIGAGIIDSNLKNAWGIAISDENDVWISSNEPGVSVVYSPSGQPEDTPVVIPGGSPTGDLYNTTSDFVIPSTGQTSEFIFATENGTIAAWASGDSAITVVDHSADSAVYKGIAMGKSNGANFLFATDFRNAAVDVYDASFHYMAGIKFVDPNIPEGYAPFNIVNIGDKLYVTYAKQLLPEKKDDDKGPGHGFVDIYNTDGTFDHRFASQDSLNSPWGIAQVPSGIGILVGNFGDGKINIYNNDGVWQGNLSTAANTPVVINGLWSIVFPKNTNGDDRKLLYFTAGPNDESNGLFGYLRLSQ